MIQSVQSFFDQKLPSSFEYELMVYQKKQYKRTAIRSSAIFVTNLEQLWEAKARKILQSIPQQQYNTTYNTKQNI